MRTSAVILVVVMGGAVIGIGLGLTLFAFSDRPHFEVFVVAPTPTAIRPTSTPLPARGAIGATGRLPKIGGEFNYSLVWVEETGLWAFNRAYENRDNKGMDRVLDIYEVLRVPDTSTVKVVNRSGDLMQVEVMDGPMAGRRGWVAVTYLIGV